MKHSLSAFAAVAALLAAAPSYAQDAVDKGVALPTTAFDKLNTSLRASQLLGATVYSPDGQTIGEIKEMLISPETIAVDAVVVSVGGFLGVGDKTIAVPMEKLYRGQENRLTLDASKDQLKAAPQYDYGSR
ncbi:MAG TPA: PRC-barrel domain-containing protein [Azospirillum sp.]|nr:PRC-barrel domain-containing protein [Azospirillum sp.]